VKGGEITEGIDYLGCAIDGGLLHDSGSRLGFCSLN
jgi:hypothetical protein